MNQVHAVARVAEALSGDAVDLGRSLVVAGRYGLHVGGGAIVVEQRDGVTIICGLFLFYDGVEEDDVGEGAVEGVGGERLDGLDDFHAIDDVAEDGVGAVEMGRAASREVGLPHLIVHLDAVLLQRSAHLPQGSLAEAAAIDDVELRRAAAHFGVCIVALACCGQRATFVEEPGQTELRLQRVAEVSVAEGLVARGRLQGAVSLRVYAAVGVAALDHEILDDAMKERAVEDTLSHILKEIVAMARCLVAQLHADDAVGGLQSHDSRLLLLRLGTSG